MAVVEQLKGGSRAPNAVVVFIHGLQGDKTSTWRSGVSDDKFWPKWLLEDLPGLRALVVGYESTATSWTGSSMALTDRATNVAEQLINQRILLDKPIIFIAHSLGGIIVKQMFRYLEGRQRSDERCQKLIFNTKLVVFMATPHSGSRTATLGDRFSMLFRPSAIAKNLVFADSHLRDLNNWYRTFAVDKMKHLVLSETVQSNYLGVIVDQVSSDPGIPDARVIPIDSDHTAICKPVDRNSEIYNHVKSEIEVVLEQLVQQATYVGHVSQKIKDAPQSIDPAQRATDRLKQHQLVLENISANKTFRVLLCGPPSASTSTGSILKQRLQNVLETEDFDVILGESDGLSNQHFNRYGNAIVDEFEFAKANCNAVIVIAETIGTWCEISLFSWQIFNDTKSRRRGVDLIVLVSDEHMVDNEFFRAGTYALVNAYGKAEIVDMTNYDATGLLERLRSRRLLFSGMPRRKPRRARQ